MVNMNISKRWEGYENRIAMRSDRIISDPQHHNLGVGLKQFINEERRPVHHCYVRRTIRMTEKHPVQYHDERHGIFRRRKAEYKM